MSTSGSTLVAALEQAWQAIQAKHPDVPDAVVIVGSGRRGRSSHQLLGHYWPERWATDAGSGHMPELFIAGELLAEGGAAILQTLLHEAAHGLAATRRVKDCSRSGNRYHNRRFADHATELGLDPPVTPSAAQGYSGATLGFDTEAQYADVIVALDAAIDVRLKQRVAAGAGGRSGKRIAVSCSCGRRLQLTLRAYEDGPILCGNCRSRFIRDRYTSFES